MVWLFAAFAGTQSTRRYYRRIMPHSKPIRALVRSAANTSPIIKQDKAMKGNWLSQELLQPQTSRSSCAPWTRCLFISLVSNTLCVDVYNF